MIEELKHPQSDSSAPSGRLHPLVVALVSLKRIRFGERCWSHRFRWLYLPWKWAYKKSAHGGWFFLTLRTPLEMIVGVENLARWQNKRGCSICRDDAYKLFSAAFGWKPHDCRKRDSHNDEMRDGERMTTANTTDAL